MTLFFLENAEKYKNIVHQRDVWHGGKSIAKKISAVRFLKNVFYLCVV